MLLETTRRKTPTGVPMLSHYADNILSVVIARKELSHENMQTLAGRVMAHAVGTPGDAAVDATPALVKPEPFERSTSEVEPEPFLVSCVHEAPKLPPASSLYYFMIPKLL